MVNENFDILIISVVFIVVLSLIIQGWMIMNAHYGYSKSPKVKHPELNDVKAGDSLLVVRFTEEDLDNLYKRVTQQKMEELFEEPSTYEDEVENDDN